MNNSSIQYEHYRGNEEFVKRIYDLMDQSEVRKREVITPFFSPDQIAIATSVLGKNFPYTMSGGYEGSERCRFVLGNDNAENFHIIHLKASYNSSFQTLCHRDVLGALMHLSLQREKIGDILCNQDSVHIFIDEEIENYIVCNLTRIKKASLHFKRSDERLTRCDSLHYRHYIVASLRLDAIVSAITHVSRNKAASFIQSGYVKVNHVVLEQSSFLCNNNSAISIRGYGRYLFTAVVKKTKKDRIVIEVGEYE